MKATDLSRKVVVALLEGSVGRSAWLDIVGILESALAEAKADAIEAAAVVVEECEGDALPMEKIADRIRALKETD